MLFAWSGLAAQVLTVDGDFAAWSTALRHPESATASGTRQPDGGAPGPHYRITHTQPVGSGLGVTSVSFPEGVFVDVSAAASSASLEFRLDHREEDLDPEPIFGIPDVFWVPILEQGGRRFRSLDVTSSSVSPVFRSEAIVVARTRFRAEDGAAPLSPDFSGQAPLVRLGVVIQTIPPYVRPGGRAIQVGIDNFSVRVSGPQAPGPDLWVTKSDGLDYLCDPSCGAAIREYTIRFGNRGSRPARGVVVTDFLPEFHRRLFSDFRDWACGADDRGPCRLQVGGLGVGESRTVSLRVVGVEDRILERGAVNEVMITDDGRNGPEQVIEDNRGYDVTGAAPCADPFGGLLCCAFELLYSTVHGGDEPAARAKSGKRLGSKIAAVFETASDLHLMYRVRDQVLQATPGGRRAVDLYYTHTAEISRLLAQDALLRRQALSTLGLWLPNLHALVAGKGARLAIDSSQVAALASFLDRLAATASPALEQVIARERQAIGLDSFAGLTVEQGLERFNRLTCQAGETTLCLGAGRFRVEADYTTPAAAGAARAVALTSDTGYFTFFDPANVEVVAKVLDGCGVNGRHWVFAAGLTDVRVVITVTDTRTGAARTYPNPRGRPFQPVQDTDAFATCP